MGFWLSMVITIYFSVIVIVGYFICGKIIEIITKMIRLIVNLLKNHILKMV